MKLKDAVIIAVTILVILGLFIYINPESYIPQILSFNKFYLSIIVILFLIDLSLRVIRWWFMLLSQEHHLPFKALVYPSLASSFLNLVLPGRAGELVRLYALRDEYDVRYSVGLSVIIVEQVINMMGLIIVASLSLGLIMFTGIKLENTFLNTLIPYAFLGSLVMIIAVILLFIIDPNNFIPLFFFLPEKIKSKVIRLVHTFRFGLETIKKKFYIFWVALFSSITIWFIEGVIIWIITMSLWNRPEFEFQVALFASALGNLNFLFPILPGAALQYDAFLAIILSLSSYYPGSGAFSVAFTDRAIKTITLGILGSISLLKLGGDTMNVLRRRTDDAQKIEKAKEQFAD